MDAAPFRHHAFISYNHGADRARAAALQRVLETIAKPFYRRRNLRVFRDETNLAANPELWPTIEAALAGSEFLIFLACPGSAASPWCARELEWWLARRSRETLLIVLTGGDLVYAPSRHDFDWTRTTALPPTLRGVFPEEPLHCDLRWAEADDPNLASLPRFRADVLPVAAALHHSEPRDLDSEDLRQFRRTRWFWRSAGIALALLTAISLAAAWIAEHNRREAERAREIAVARRLIAESDAVRLARAANLPHSVLLAVEAARRLEPLGESAVDADRSLRTALASLPRRPVILPHPDVIAFETSADGKRGVSIGRQGAIGLWDLATARLLSSQNTGLSVSAAVLSPALDLAALEVERDAVLWSLTEQRALARIPHDGLVTALRFSPDAGLLATGSLDRFVRLISLPDGRERARLPQGDSINAIAFSADGKRIAVGTGSSVAAGLLKRTAPAEAAQIWDIATRKRVAYLPHDRSVEALAFSPDGRLIATGSLDGSARLWDIETGREQYRIQHEDVVRTIAFSPDGRRLASASAPYLVASKNQSLILSDTQTGRELGRLMHENGIRELAFAPDGRRIATVSADQTARLMDSSGAELARLAVGGLPNVVRFSPDGKALYAAGPGIFGIAAEGGYAPPTVDIAESVRQLSYSADERLLAVLSLGDSVRVLDGESLGLRFVAHHPALAVAAAFSPDGSRLATGSVDGTVLIHDTASGQPIARVDHGGEISVLAFSPDGGQLAIAGKTGMLRLLEAGSGRETFKLQDGKEVVALRYSPDGRLVVSADSEGTIRIRDSATGAERLQLSAGMALTHLALSPDGAQLAAAGSGPDVRVWRIATGEAIPYPRLAGNVSQLSYAPDGRLVAATWQGQMRLGHGGGTQATELHHDDSVTALAFSADGRHMATGSSDRTARIWRLADGQLVSRLAHPVGVSALAFSPRTARLATAASDQLTPPHSVAIWNWVVSDLIDEACQRLGRNLDLAEWTQSLPGEAYRKTCPGLPPHPSVIRDAQERARLAAEQGDTDTAREAHGRAAELAADSDDAMLANEVCWFGSLDGAATEVRRACERAVQLAPDDGRMHDSFGLAKALTGDLGGAVASFETCLKLEGAKDPAAPALAQRRSWIAELRAVRNPFDTALIQRLRRGE